MLGNIKSEVVFQFSYIKNISFFNRFDLSLNFDKTDTESVFIDHNAAKNVIVGCIQTTRQT